MSELILSSLRRKCGSKHCSYCDLQIFSAYFPLKFGFVLKIAWTFQFLTMCICLWSNPQQTAAAHLLSMLKPHCQTGSLNLNFNICSREPVWPGQPTWQMRTRPCKTSMNCRVSHALFLFLSLYCTVPSATSPEDNRWVNSKNGSAKQLNSQC